MRLIGHLPNLESTKIFSSFLLRESIENQWEKEVDKNGSVTFSLWVHNEDQVEVATKWLTEFSKNPSNSFFKPPEPIVLLQEKPDLPLDKKVKVKREFKTPLITLLIFISACIFLIEELSAPTIVLKENEQALFPMSYSPPIMKALLFDYPKAYEMGDQIIHQFTPEQIQNQLTDKENDPKLQELLTTLQNTPYWKGAYDEFILNYRAKNPSWSYHGPWFEKIQEGEYYRLFTPCLLHGNLLHILFNVLWIIILGYQIEKKINSFKILLFIVITGIFSNFCEYLMSGPNFLGLSGIVAAMAGFIWMRRKKAPWEGYLFHSSTFLFLAIYILGMFFLEFVSFFLQLFGHSAISPGIANTAHISGALFGMLLGTLKFFAKHIPN